MSALSRVVGASIPARWVLVIGFLLTAADLVSLWVAAPGLLAIWSLVVGAGFAVVGALTVRRPAGPFFVLAAAGLLIVPLLQAAGAERVALGLVGVAGGVVVPCGLLRVAGPGPAGRTARGLDASVPVCGLAAAIALVTGPYVAQVVAVSAFVSALVGAGWLRFERSAGEQRRRVLWLVLGVSTGVLAALLFGFATEGIALGEVPFALVIALLSLLLPVSAGIAVLAPDAVDVRAVISQVVLLAVMATLVVAVFSGVLAVLALTTGAAPSAGVLGLLVTMIAAGFHPVLVRVRTFVDEMLFGGRPDPVDTLTRLGGQLTAGSTPQEWLHTLRAALGVPAVVLRQDGVELASSGRLDGASVTVTALRVGTEVVGELAVGLPAGQLRPPPTTRAVLGLVSAPLAQALRAARLGEQLQASRGRVVAALEEERRRMRRDLHDGLGPTLTGIAYSADAAGNLLPPGADRAAAELRALRADVAEAIAEIRRIVDGLRPRALDELGLLGALQQRLTRLRAADGRAMAVTVTGPESLPELPAAVEVVAYRMVVEAVTNLARHSDVDEARVLLSFDDDDDDDDDDERGRMSITVSGPESAAPGGGTAADWVPGVGLTSMRERVEQIGGTLDVEPGPHGGVVRARIPTALELSE